MPTYMFHALSLGLSRVRKQFVQARDVLTDPPALLRSFSFSMSLVTRLLMISSSLSLLPSLKTKTQSYGSRMVWWYLRSCYKSRNPLLRIRIGDAVIVILNARDLHQRRFTVHFGFALHNPKNSRPNLPRDFALKGLLTGFLQHLTISENTKSFR